MGGTLPNCIIAGAPKSGTSSLYFWLAAHPEVCASRRKETFFFSDQINRFNQSLNFIEHGINRYPELFEGCSSKDKIVFEATAPYIYQEIALQNLPGLPTDPLFIFILREPAARLYSQYLFEKYRTHRKVTTFKEYIKLDGLFDHGEYSNYLKKWIDRAGKERIHVLLLEDLMEDRSTEMKKIAQFLSIDQGFYDDFEFVKHNETLVVKSGWFHQLGLKLQPLIPHRVQEFLLPFYLRVNAGSRPERSEEDIRLLEHLKERYKPSVKELAELLPDLNLSAWE
ncbi:MAG: sulfotransferase domain-containing protein [Bacteroidota bacterium]|nr:sulfotransferase domain-containing protein [Bacteroidota bacterium]